MSDLTEKKIGKYKISSLLGRGGMGSVYLAEDDTGAKVALKVIEEGPGVTADTIERFHREAQASKALREHPNIVTVYDSGTDGSHHYIAMQYVEGFRGSRSLEDLQEKEPPSQRQVLELGVKVARALDYAHSKGLVHRDIKPGNILIDKFGNPLVADFGLVKVADKQSLTMTGKGAGTPYYMSPEQVRADKDLDGRSDIYSLGVMLYELLSDGSLPYTTTEGSAVFKDILEGLVTPLRKVKKDTSADVEAVVMKTLELDRKSRYISAEELALDLEKAAKGEPVKAGKVTVIGRAVRWGKRKKGLAAALAGVLILGLAVAAVSWLVYRERMKEAYELELVFEDDFEREDSAKAEQAPRKRLGEVLVDMGVVTATQRDEALDYARKEGLRTGEAVVALGYASASRVQEALSLQSEPVKAAPAPDALGEGWGIEGAAWIKDGVMGIDVGQVFLKQTVPGDARLEFDAWLASDSSGQTGAFINGASGFWDAYDLDIRVAADGQQQYSLNRNQSALTSLEGELLRINKPTRFVIERYGNRLSVTIGSREIEYLDLNPLDREKNGRIGFKKYADVDIRFDNVKVYRLKSPRRVSPLAVGDGFAEKGEHAYALAEYRRVLDTLGPKETELCELKIGSCLLALKEYSQALEWYEKMRRQRLSLTAHRQVLSGLFELSIHLEDWGTHLEVLEELLDDKGATAEHEAALGALEKRYLVWRHRDFWADGRAAQVLAAITKRSNVLVKHGYNFRLPRFSWIIRGREGLADLLGTLEAANRKGPNYWGQKGLAISNLKASLLWHDGHKNTARVLWALSKANFRIEEEGYTGFGNFTAFELDKAYRALAVKTAENLSNSVINRKLLKEWSPVKFEVPAYLLGSGRDEVADVLYRRYGDESTAIGLTYVSYHLWRGERQWAIGYLKQTARGENLGGLETSIIKAVYTKLLDSESATLEEIDLDGGLEWMEPCLLVVPAAYKAAGDLKRCRESLEMIRDVSYPWEPGHKIALRWLKELKAEQPQLF